MASAHSAEDAVTVIKKYANRRLYNTGTSAYVTLEDLAEMVRNGDEFVVLDAKTGEDITRSALTQIIFEQEGKAGQSLLPIAFLRQLIRFYGDSLQNLVPRYLEMSLEGLTREQENMRRQMANAFGMSAPAFAALEEQARANMALFERAFRMFTPSPPPEEPEPEPPPEPPRAAGPAGDQPRSASDIDDLRREMAEMKARLDRLAGG